MIYLLNSPVITAYGAYSYHPVSVNEVVNLLQFNPFISAIGHVETARVLTELLNIEVPFNRIAIQQKPEDIFVVFKPHGRLEEKKVYNEIEIINLGFEIGLLKKMI